MRPDDLQQILAETIAELPAGALVGIGPATLADGDAWLLNRRVAEAQDGTFSEEEYSEAASALRLLGHDTEADSLASIARTTTSLEKADREWRNRYRDRQPTLTEQRDAELLKTGRVQHMDTGMVAGIDGAVYTPAVLTGPAGATVPAVVVATHAGMAEVVTGFRTEDDRQAWLADRAQPIPGREPKATPLTACSEGPDCRIAWEERILARLLTHGDPDGKITASLSPTVFSTHTRFETYMAFLATGPYIEPNMEALRGNLATRLLRAPDWAATYIGRPCGHLALAYADRLAATPVTKSQAKAAVADLVREDTQSAGASAKSLAGRTSYSSRPVSARALAAPQLTGLQRPEAPVPGIAPQM